MDTRNIYSSNKPVSSDGLFLKIQPDSKVRVRILGIPAVFESRFEDKVTKEVKISTKYAWPVYNHDEGKTQVFQGGAQVYNGLLALIEDDDWGDPSNYDVTIGRAGSGTDTKYSVVGSPKSKDVPEDATAPDVVAIQEKSPNNSNVRLLGEEVTKSKDVVLDDIDDKPIDLSEIPF